MRKHTANHKEIGAGRAVIIALLVVFIFAACGHMPQEQGTALSAFPAADLSAYPCFANEPAPTIYREMSVRDVQRLMDEKASFVFIASFADCPWCNVVLPVLTEVAESYDAQVGLINTRKDPSWQSNLDITDYDLFVELFGAYLDEDEEGRLHLYTPHVFFVRGGKVVYEHDGALPEMGDDPEMLLNDEQLEAFKELYRAGFELL